MFIEPAVLFNRGNARASCASAAVGLPEVYEERSGDLENIIWRVDIETVYFNEANIL